MDIGRNFGICHARRFIQFGNRIFRGGSTIQRVQVITAPADIPNAAYYYKRAARCFPSINAARQGKFSRPQLFRPTAGSWYRPCLAFEQFPVWDTREWRFESRGFTTLRLVIMVPQEKSQSLLWRLQCTIASSGSRYPQVCTSPPPLHIRQDPLV